MFELAATSALLATLQVETPNFSFLANCTKCVTQVH
jgi:hypothetical protein